MWYIMYTHQVHVVGVHHTLSVPVLSTCIVNFYSFTICFYRTVPVVHVVGGSSSFSAQRNMISYRALLSTRLQASAAEGANGAATVPAITPAVA